MGLLGASGLGQGTGLGQALSFSPNQSELKMITANEIASNKAQELANTKADAESKFIYDHSQLPKDIAPPLQNDAKNIYTQGIKDAMANLQQNPNGGYLQRNQILADTNDKLNQIKTLSDNFNNNLKEYTSGNLSPAAMEHFKGIMQTNNLNDYVNAVNKPDPTGGLEYQSANGVVRYNPVSKINPDNTIESEVSKIPTTESVLQSSPNYTGSEIALTTKNVIPKTIAQASDMTKAWIQAHPDDTNPPSFNSKENVANQMWSNQEIRNAYMRQHWDDVKDVAPADKQTTLQKNFVNQVMNTTSPIEKIGMTKFTTREPSDKLTNPTTNFIPQLGTTPNGSLSNPLGSQKQITFTKDLKTDVNIDGLPEKTGTVVIRKDGDKWVPYAAIVNPSFDTKKPESSSNPQNIYKPIDSDSQEKVLKLLGGKNGKFDPDAFEAKQSGAKLSQPSAAAPANNSIPTPQNHAYNATHTVNGHVLYSNDGAKWYDEKGIEYGTNGKVILK